MKQESHSTNQILLCALNSKYIHSSLAVHSLKTAYDFYCRKYGQNFGSVTVCEFTINDSHQSILHRIISKKPDIVCFSVYLWNINFVSALCRDIKRILPKCRIILGGPEVSYGTDDLPLKSDEYDMIIAGEGEKSFWAALACFAGKYQAQLPDDFLFSVCGKTIKALFPVKLDDIPFIYNDNNISLFKNRIIYYESSRGCPFSCAYCLSSAEEGVRYLSEERVLEDLKYFISQEIPLVKFVDRTFNCNKKRAFNILKYIIESPGHTCFHFEVAADLFDSEILELLKSAPKGRIQFEIGIQSVNEKALKTSCRKTDVQKVLNNIKMLISMENINIHADLIAGLPHENYEEFASTFNKAYEYCNDSRHYIHQLQIGFLKLLHGAPLNNMIKEHEYIFSANSPYQVLKNKYLNCYELNKLTEFEDVFERYYNSGRYNETLCHILKNTAAFDTPFAFYSSLADFYAEKGLLFSSISSRRMCDILVEFLSKHYNCSDMHNIKKLLLYDYFASDSSDLPAESLKEVWMPERTYKQKANEILAEKGILPDKKHTVRLVSNEYYIFDYSSKNPVTGRFGHNA